MPTHDWHSGPAVETDRGRVLSVFAVWDVPDVTNDASMSYRTILAGKSSKPDWVSLVQGDTDGLADGSMFGRVFNVTLDPAMDATEISNYLDAQYTAQAAAEWADIQAKYGLYGHRSNV